MLLIQFTGLSGAGKTSIARYLEKFLSVQNLSLEIIDGDDYRKTVCKDLGFSKEDRQENIRRLGKIASEIKNKDVIIIAAVNPYSKIRKELINKYGAKLIWINCDLQVLIKRDTKGLYKKSILPDNHPDKIYNLSGVTDVYEIPDDADLIVNTSAETLKESSDQIAAFIWSFL